MSCRGEKKLGVLIFVPEVCRLSLSQMKMSLYYVAEYVRCYSTFIRPLIRS
jgi:hypothetical protein